MRLPGCSLLLFLALHTVSAQRHPLDGKYLVFTIIPQQGDGRWVIHNIETGYAKEIPGGISPEDTKKSTLKL